MLYLMPDSPEGNPGQQTELVDYAWWVWWVWHRGLHDDLHLRLGVSVWMGSSIPLKVLFYMQDCALCDE